MKSVRLALPILLLCGGVLAQTVHEGQHVFFSDARAIVVTADAAVAVQKLNSPYVMFMIYMGMKDFQNTATVSRNDVVMIYKDKEYKMPTVEEFGEKYGGLLNDVDLYGHQGKESLILSQMRFWKYQAGGDFFPLPNQLAVDAGSMAGNLGFRTKVYFKNPGFKTGDEITIEVKDKKNPELNGSVAVILK
jgi:hypothetical protein